MTIFVLIPDKPWNIIYSVLDLLLSNPCFLQGQGKGRWPPLLGEEISCDAEFIPACNVQSFAPAAPPPPSYHTAESCVFVRSDRLYLSRAVICISVITLCLLSGVAGGKGPRTVRTWA